MSLQVRAAWLCFLLFSAVNSSIYAAPPERSLTGIRVSQCLQYEPTAVDLEGEIVRKTFVNASGKKEIVWLLKLGAPICVDSAGADSINQKAEKVERLQLVIMPRDYKNYQKYLAKNVVASGTLFYGHTQHHFTEVLLSVTAIRSKS